MSSNDIELKLKYKRDGNKNYLLNFILFKN